MLNSNYMIPNTISTSVMFTLLMAHTKVAEIKDDFDFHSFVQ